MLGGKAHPHEARRVEPGTAWPRACMAMAIPDVITSDWASAVFDTPLYYMYLCCCIACIMLLHACTMLLYARIMLLLYACIMLLYACIMLLYLVLCLYYAAVCLYCAGIMLLDACIMLLYACIMP